MRHWPIGRADLRSLALCVLGAAALAAAPGCAKDDPETALVAANASLEEARAELGAATARVEAIEEKLAALREDLAEAEQDRRIVEEAFAEAEADVAARATDDVLFRAVQRRLLEDPDLEDFAIRAQVSEGVVIVSGFVGNDDLRKLAIEIAVQTPGVRRVENQIRIPGPPPEAPAAEG